MVGKTVQNLPPPQSPFVEANRNLSYDGYQFLLALLNNALQTIPQAAVSTGLKATGATQATAVALSSQWNVFSTVPASGGCLLQTYQVGQSQMVYNGDAANSLNVYPPPGYSIDAIAPNVPYSLAIGKMQIFNFISSTKILSTQLG